MLFRADNDLVGGEERDHRTGAEAFEVESHELEAEGPENPGELGGHLESQGAGEFVLSDFDAGDFAVMADAKLAEAEASERVFALFNGGQGLGGDGTAVFD